MPVSIPDTTPNPHQVLELTPRLPSFLCAYSDDRALTKIGFGSAGGELELAGYIKKSQCKGTSFHKGAEVEYKGKLHVVTSSWADGDCKLKPKPKPRYEAVLDSSMIDANFGGKKLDTGDAMLVAAFLPKCP